MKYMLDTNICVDLIRQKPAGLIERLLSHVPGEVGVSIITVAVTVQTIHFVISKER